MVLCNKDIKNENYRRYKTGLSSTIKQGFKRFTVVITGCMLFLQPIPGMKARAVLVIIFMAGLMGSVQAQDTSLPVISQHAYDSTLRALKLQQITQKAKQDSINAAVKADSLLKAAKAQAVQDSLLQVAHLAKEAEKRDSAIKHDSVVTANAVTDTTKKHKIRYTPTGYLSVAYGEGYAQGNFKADAYPVKGGEISVTAAFPGLVSRFGVVFKIDYGFNGFNNVRYTDTLNHRAYAITNNNQLAISVNQSYKYTYKSLLMGLWYTYPMGKLSVDARLMFGAMMATIPGVVANITDYSNGLKQLNITTYSASGRAFAFDEGIAVRYLAKPLISVMLSADNYSAAPNFTFINNNITTDLTGTARQDKTVQSTVKQSFHVFTVSIGVGYTIRPKGTK